MKRHAAEVAGVLIGACFAAGVFSLALFVGPVATVAACAVAGLALGGCLGHLQKTRHARIGAVS